MIQLSYSAAQKYLMSPMSYFLHYIMRIRPVETGSALVFGNAIDDALNELLRQHGGISKTNRDPKDLFDEVWTHQNVNGNLTDLRTTDCIKYSKSDYDPSILTEDDLKDCEKYNPNWVCLRRKAHMFIDAYKEQILPRIKKIILVQHYVKLTNELNDKFVGYVDFIAEWEDGRIVIFDNKTSSIKYKDDSAVESEQLATYFESLRHEFHIDAVGYVVIPKKIRKKKEPLVPIEVYISSVKEKIIDNTFEMYDRVLTGIKTGQFECNRQNCENNPFGCSYKRYCDSHGTDLTGLIELGSKKEKNT